MGNLGFNVHGPNRKKSQKKSKTSDSNDSFGEEFASFLGTDVEKVSFSESVTAVESVSEKESRPKIDYVNDSLSKEEISDLFSMVKDVMDKLGIHIEKKSSD
jgi:hypothetical protein